MSKLFGRSALILGIATLVAAIVTEALLHKGWGLWYAIPVVIVGGLAALCYRTYKAKI